MKLEKIAQIKNYAAGRNGNLIVFLVPDLKLETTYMSPNGKKERTIKPYIATAEIPLQLQDKISKMVDDATYSDKVIVVNSAFMHLFNKTQLALLARQNGKENFVGSLTEHPTDIDRQVAGNVAAIKTVGQIRARMAMGKADKRVMKDSAKAARGYHRAYKKGTDCQQCLPSDEALESAVNDILSKVSQVAGS